MNYSTLQNTWMNNYTENFKMQKNATPTGVPCPQPGGGIFECPLGTICVDGGCTNVGSSSSPPTPCIPPGKACTQDPSDCCNDEICNWPDPGQWDFSNLSPIPKICGGDGQQP